MRNNMSDPASERTTLHRHAHRAAYDCATIYANLDEGFVCHVGLTTTGGVDVRVVGGPGGEEVAQHHAPGAAAQRLLGQGPHRLAARRQATYDLPIWAKVMPLCTVSKPAMVDPGMRVDAALPGYAVQDRRPVSRDATTIGATGTAD
jgi:hypothetical protein